MKPGMFRPGRAQRKARSLVLAGVWSMMFFGSWGCVSVGSFRSAWTPDPGRLEVSVQPQVATRLDPELPTTTPFTDVVIRTGIGERSAFEVRVGPSGFHSAVQLELFERPQAALSIAPALGGVRYPVTEDDGLHVLEYRFPLILGFRTRSGTEFVFTPQGILASVGWYHPERFDAALGVFSFGIRQPLFQGLEVHPEVTVGYAVPIGPIIGIDEPSFDEPRWMFGAGMGFSFSPR